MSRHANVSLTASVHWLSPGRGSSRGAGWLPANVTVCIRASIPMIADPTAQAKLRTAAHSVRLWASQPAASGSSATVRQLPAAVLPVISHTRLTRAWIGSARSTSASAARSSALPPTARSPTVR